MLDFKIVLKQIATVYPQCTCKCSQLEVINIFKMFYNMYEEYRGVKHPFLKNETMKIIIEKISNDDVFEYKLEDYEVIIPKYFETEFSKCDYSICHFMSGNIRQMRYYEVCY